MTDFLEEMITSSTSSSMVETSLTTQRGQSRRHFMPRISPAFGTALLAKAVANEYKISLISAPSTSVYPCFVHLGRHDADSKLQ